MDFTASLRLIFVNLLKNYVLKITFAWENSMSLFHKVMQL